LSKKSGRVFPAQNEVAPGARYEHIPRGKKNEQWDGDSRFILLIVRAVGKVGGMKAGAIKRGCLEDWPGGR